MKISLVGLPCDGADYLIGEIIESKLASDHSVERDTVLEGDMMTEASPGAQAGIRIAADHFANVEPSDLYVLIMPGANQTDMCDEPYSRSESIEDVQAMIYYFCSMVNRGDAAMAITIHCTYIAKAAIASIMGAIENV